MAPTNGSDAREAAQAWLALDDDPVTRAELEAMLASGEDEALTERFSARLAFGTAGLRGLQGAGPMRMNRVVVRQTSAGIGDYLVDDSVDDRVDDPRGRGVVIGYDGRINSDVFATACAAVFLQRGYAVYLWEGSCPTPLVAYAVLDLGAAAGVVITASHNPPEYNGYKVFWGNGAQIIPPHDVGIAAAIERAELHPEANDLDLDAAVAAGTLRRVGEDIERRYRGKARRLLRNPGVIGTEPITIAYTPLHGVGAGPVTRLLAEAGFNTVVVEPSQAEPDGSFPTVSFPNPEEPGAMDRVTELGTRLGADLIIANDPDADRLAIAIPDTGGFRPLSGDQIGALLADYLMSDKNEVPPGDDRKPLLLTTVVSSQLLEAMATARGADYRETLTGFKWIANTAIDLVAQNRMVLGYEEAIGFSVGELVRDKDGLSAALLFAELCAVCKHRKQTLADRLENIYRAYGVHLTRQVSLVRDGSEGATEIAAIMDNARSRAPAEIAGARVARTIDLAGGADGLPPTNALIFRLAGGNRVIMRPSGTEPKLKCYYEVREDVAPSESVGVATSRAREALEKLVSDHQRLVEPAAS